MDQLTAFGLFAIIVQLICYGFEHRSPWFIFVFAFGCIMGSIYGFLQGAWPFGVMEIFWTILAFQRWWKAKSAYTANI
jgi:hypothetical protein